MTDTTMATAPTDFRVGYVLSRAIAVLSRNLVKFALLAAIIWSPLLILGVLVGLGAYFGVVSRGVLVSPPAKFGVVAATVILTFLLLMMSEAVILYGTFQDMRGRPVAIGEALRKGLARVLPIIALSICLALGLGFSILLLVFPVFILLAMWFVALPVCVVERLGPFASMDRSASLTKGHRWRIFAIAILLPVASQVVEVGIKYPFTQLSGATAASLVVFVWQVLFTAYNAVVVAVAYYELRAGKEGIDIERMAAVFD